MTSIQLQTPESTAPGRLATRRRRRRPPHLTLLEPRLDEELPRRFLNVAVALAGLMIVAPVMITVAALIKITSRGPVIYAQQRVGVDRRWRNRDRRSNGRRSEGRRDDNLGGRPFTIYKFRTMHDGQGDAQVWATPDDPRVTRVGRILRKYRLDELPQLLNVLKGDMNIVGPRPEQPQIFQELRQHIANYEHRQRVLPGITGWAQINHHYDVSVDSAKRKVTYDLEYLSRCSTMEDFKIMLRTLPVIALRKGAW